MLALAGNLVAVDSHSLLHGVAISQRLGSALARWMSIYILQELRLFPQLPHLLVKPRCQCRIIPCSCHQHQANVICFRLHPAQDQSSRHGIRKKTVLSKIHSAFVQKRNRTISGKKFHSRDALTIPCNNAGFFPTSVRREA
jgi:hypothetical protein